MSIAHNPFEPPVVILLHNPDDFVFNKRQFVWLRGVVVVECFGLADGSHDGLVWRRGREVVFFLVIGSCIDTGGCIDFIVMAGLWFVVDFFVQP